MTLLAFGRKVRVPEAMAHLAASTVVAIPPPRFRECTAKVVMHGSDDTYEDWVAIELKAATDEVCAAFARWITGQMTRRGFALVPLLTSDVYRDRM
jgi:hypothetical protein